MISGIFPENFLSDIVQEAARRMRLEGTGQKDDNHVRINVCGNKEAIDNFLDFLHQGSLSWELKKIEIEPFLNEKDYRGVFRIIA